MYLRFRILPRQKRLIMRIWENYRKLLYHIIHTASRFSSPFELRIRTFQIRFKAAAPLLLHLIKSYEAHHAHFGGLSLSRTT